MATRMDTVDGRNETGIGSTLENLGANVIRYGLVIVLLWVGLIHFTAYEAEGSQGLVANSPLMSWMLSIFSVRTVSALVGTAEIIFGLLIALRPFSPFASALGSFGAIVMFLITLSFVLTTPGVWQPNYGFPFPSGAPGQFLLKDLILLAAAVWTAGEALRAANASARRH